MFGDSADDNAGMIQYNPNNDRMMFTTNGSEMMRIDSSGNVLIGKQGSAITSTGVELFNRGEIFVTRKHKIVVYLIDLLMMVRYLDF